MKKVYTFLIILMLSINYSLAGVDRYSQEYLQNKNHFTLTKSIAEWTVKKTIKKALKKETGIDFDVKFEGYTASSIKKGIFKYLELTGENVQVDNIDIPYIHLQTITDYNYIDYTQNPMVFLSDMTYSYDILLSDDSINQALKDSDYLKVISKVNKIASPLFVIKGVRSKIVDNKLYFIIDYNLPIATSKDKAFVVQSDFEVVNSKIKAKNVKISSSYGNLGLNKVANLVNYLNPLEFTLGMLDEKKHNGKVENIKIVDNKVKIDGKIYLKKAD